MEAKYPEITLGETVCIKLKDIYFPEKPWVDCYQDVAEKFTQLKIAARKFYAGMDDLSILIDLARYSASDSREMLENEA